MLVSSVNSVQSLYALQLAQARERTSEPVSTLPSSWGADTVTLSDAALVLLQTAGSAAAQERAAASGNSPAAAAGAEGDLAAELQALGLENAGQFSALLDKLRSGDPEAALDALAQITGKPTREIREALSGMPDDQLAAFISHHTGLTAKESAFLTGDLRAAAPGNA